MTSTKFISILKINLSTRLLKNLIIVEQNKVNDGVIPRKWVCSLSHWLGKLIIRSYILLMITLEQRQ